MRPDLAFEQRDEFGQDGGQRRQVALAQDEPGELPGGEQRGQGKQRRPGTLERRAAHG
jgi:hypothetical protein